MCIDPSDLHTPLECSMGTQINKDLSKVTNLVRKQIKVNDLSNIMI